MGFSYDYQGSSTFLTYTVEQNDVIDSMTLGMLTNNRISGLVPTLFTQMDDERYIKYNVTGRITAKNCFSSMVNKRRLLGLFRSMVDAMRAAEDYMFDSKSILLDMQYIFVDITTCDALFICVPIEGANETGRTAGEFIKDVLFQSRYDQSENCDYIAKLMNYLNSTPQINLDSFASLLGSLDADETQSQKQATQGATIHQKQSPAPATIPQNQSGASAAASQRTPQPAIQPIASQQTVERYPTPQKDTIRQTIGVVHQDVQQQNRNKPVDLEKNQEKPMSMWYLLNHYSKENLEKYRAQKGDSGNKLGNTEKKTAEKKGKKRGVNAATPAFAIPGQAIPMETASSQPEIPESPKVPDERAVTPEHNTPSDGYRTSPEAVIPRIKPQESHLDFGETAFLSNDSDETVMLGKENAAVSLTPQLVRKKTSEHILITNELFRIGRDADFNDFAMQENRHVGHTHCHIVTRNGEYFMVDDNSKNHTRVNGNVIYPGVETKLAHGYSLTIADEEFEFKLF